MMLLKLSLSFLIWSVVVCAQASTPQGYSAVMRTVLKQNQQSHVLTGKVYVQGEKYRIDQQLVGVSQTLILDYFLKKVVLLLPQQKSYVESKMDEKSFRDFLMRGYNPHPKTLSDSSYTLKILREETWEGQDCEVVQITGLQKGKGKEKNEKVTMTYWLAKKLQGLPIRSQAETSYGLRHEVTLHQVKPEAFAKDFFSPPVDYARGNQGILGVDGAKVFQE